MIKYTAKQIERFGEKVRCDKCGKQITRGQCAVGFKGHICIDCARKWRADNG